MRTLYFFFVLSMSRLAIASVPLAVEQEMADMLVDALMVSSAFLVAIISIKAVRLLVTAASGTSGEYDPNGFDADGFSPVDDYEISPGWTRKMERDYVNSSPEYDSDTDYVSSK